jgi:hypothetical protein
MKKQSVESWPIRLLLNQVKAVAMGFIAGKVTENEAQSTIAEVRDEIHRRLNAPPKKSLKKLKTIKIAPPPVLIRCEECFELFPEPELNWFAGEIREWKCVPCATKLSLKKQKLWKTKRTCSPQT